MKIDVAKHISELLYEKEKVIIPNLGSFCSAYKPADTEKYGNISPPSKEVYFDEALRGYDEVLVRHIADKNQISYDAAKSEVESFVYDVKNKIVSNAVFIANIGRLYLDVHNSIVLAPSSVNFLEDAFGLPKVSYYPVSRRYEENNMAVQAEPEVKQKNSIITFFSNLWNDKSIRAVLITVVVLMIAIPQLSKLSKPENKSVSPMIIEDNQDVIDREKSLKPLEKTAITDDIEDGEEVVSSEKSVVIEKAEIINPVRTVVNLKESAVRNEEAEESVEDNKKEEESIEVKVDEPKTVLPTPRPAITYSKRREYIFSVGVFSVKEFAVTAARDIRKAGYATYVKDIEGSYRVGIKVTCEPSEVDDELVKIKKEFPQAWLMNRD